MISGHASHQIGLDVDIWFTPMPDHVLTREEREFDGAVSMVASDLTDVDAKVWDPTHMAVVRAAAEDPMVTRIFVNAAIKKADVRRGRIGPRLAGEGAAVVGPRRAFSRPHRLPAGRPRNANRNRRCRQATAAAMRSISGSSNRRCTRCRRKCRPKPLTLAGLPAACKQIVRAP